MNREDYLRWLLEVRQLRLCELKTRGATPLAIASQEDLVRDVQVTVNGIAKDKKEKGGTCGR